MVSIGNSFATVEFAKDLPDDDVPKTDPANGRESNRDVKYQVQRQAQSLFADNAICSMCLMM